MDSNHVSRRIFLVTLSLGSAAGVLGRQLALAEEPRKLDVKDPAALALGYVENAGQVDRGKFPAFVKGSNCDNCLKLEGKPGTDYRPCSLFPGKVVAVNGWCTGWTAEM